MAVWCGSDGANWIGLDPRRFLILTFGRLLCSGCCLSLCGTRRPQAVVQRQSSADGESIRQSEELNRLTSLRTIVHCQHPTKGGHPSSTTHCPERDIMSGNAHM